jgi:hypothetical protein
VGPARTRAPSGTAGTCPLSEQGADPASRQGTPPCRWPMLGATVSRGSGPREPGILRAPGSAAGRPAGSPMSDKMHYVNSWNGWKRLETGLTCSCGRSLLRAFSWPCCCVDRPRPRLPSVQGRRPSAHRCRLGRGPAGWESCASLAGRPASACRCAANRAPDGVGCGRRLRPRSGGRVAGPRRWPRSACRAPGSPATLLVDGCWRCEGCLRSVAGPIGSRRRFSRMAAIGPRSPRVSATALTDGCDRSTEPPGLGDGSQGWLRSVHGAPGSRRRFSAAAAGSPEGPRTDSHGP